MTTKSTTLLATTLLLLTGLASAGHASAGPTTQSHCAVEMGAYCVPDPDYVLDNLQDQCGRDVKLWGACLADQLALPLAGIILGPELCGRQLIRNQIDAHPALGACETSRTWTPPTTQTALEDVLDTITEALGPVGELVGGAAPLVVGLVLWAAELVLGLLDGDGDLIPDVLEPWICSVENENSNLDGYCVGNNYYP